MKYSPNVKIKFMVANIKIYTNALASLHRNKNQC